MKAIRTAVVGAGHFGRRHAEKFAVREDADLIAVVDIDADRARDVARHYGALGLADYRTLAGRVDAVSIAVPTAAHHEIARFFLDHGVHVLVEKPFTTTVEQADDLIRRARARRLVLQVGHLERFFCAESGLLRRVSAPLYVEAVRIAPFKARGTDIGVVLDLMIHDIDLVASLVGAPIVSVDAVGAPVLSEHEDIVNARLVFESGCVATITASRVAFKSERRVRIFQPDGLFSIDLLNRRVARVRKTATSGGTRLEVEERELGGHDALGAEIAGFLDAVARGGEPVVTGEDGRAALVIAGRVVESLRTHRALVERRMADRPRDLGEPPEELCRRTDEDPRS
jgi:predicted dehydrogenase